MATVTMDEREHVSLMRRAQGKASDVVRAHPLKALLYTAAAAAGGMYLLQSDGFSKIEAFAKNWFLRGLLILAAAYLLFKKGNREWAFALAGIGATALAMDWKTHSDATKAGQPASGIDEAGAVYDWQIGPDGRRVFGPKTHLDLADQLAGRVFATG